MMTNIYALVDPLTRECRYVGKADVLSRRLVQHIRDTHRATTHKTNWINSLKVDGLTPDVITLEQVSQDTWQEAEVFWVSYMLFIGARLTNGNLGGVGGVKPTAATRAKISAASAGRVLSAEHRHKIGLANSRRVCTEETRAKQSEVAKKRIGPLNSGFGKPRSAEARKNMSDAAKKRVLSPERKQQLANLLAEVRARPDVIEKRKLYSPSQETRARLSAAGKGRVKTETERQNIAAGLRGKPKSPEHKAKLSAAKTGKIMSAEAKAKMSAARKGKPHSAEHNRKNGESQSARWDRYYLEKGIEMPKKSLRRRMVREAEKKGA